MGELIGDLLPLAVGVAVSPVPIIAVILMLLSPRPTGPSLGFLFGWILGIVVVLLVVTLLVGPAGAVTGAPSTFGSVVKIVLGAAAVLLGVKQWRSRPRGDAEPAMPKWMSAIDSFTAGKAFGLGALLSGVNPKNLALIATAGVSMGSAGLDMGRLVLAGAVFVVIASISVAGPVIAYLAARRRMQQPLDELRSWLTMHNAAVMSVLLLVMGVSILGKGIGGL